MDRQDTDPEYLLGPFDASRMIRLEGMPQDVARVFASQFAAAQRLFPSFDRNITYLTWGTEAPVVWMGRHMHKDIPVELANNNGWARLAVHRGSLTPDPTLPGFVVLEAQHFGSTHAVSSLRNSFKLPNRYSPQARRSTFAESLTAIPIHEHGHTLLNELELSDLVLGSHWVGELQKAVASAVRGYQPNFHVQEYETLIEDPTTPSYELPIFAQLRDQGIHPQGLRNFHELTSDALALSVLGRRSPLIDAIGAFYNEHFGPDSQTRKSRQRGLFKELKVDAVRSNSIEAREDDASERTPLHLTDRDAKLFGIRPDARYAKFEAGAPQLTEFQVGPTRVAALTAMADQFDIPDRALEVAADVNKTLAVRTYMHAGAVSQPKATFNMGLG